MDVDKIILLEMIHTHGMEEGRVGERNLEKKE